MASHLFALFINPKNRGPNFTWEDFPNIVAKLTETQTYTSGKNLSKQDIRAAKDSAIRESFFLLREAGLLSTIDGEVK